MVSVEVLVGDLRRRGQFVVVVVGGVVVGRGGLGVVAVVVPQLVGCASCSNLAIIACMPHHPKTSRSHGQRAPNDPCHNQSNDNHKEYHPPKQFSTCWTHSWDNPPW